MSRTNHRPAFLCVFCSLCVLCLPACGYSLAGRGSFLPSYIKTMGIPTFVNRTVVFNLETMVTQKVRSEFIGRGKYQILPEATGVDALLTGEVTAVGIQPASFSTQQLASRYAITMTARIELRDMRENKVLGSGFSAFQMIFPSDPRRYRFVSSFGKPLWLSSTTSPAEVWICFSTVV